MITNYGSLKTEVANLINRTDQAETIKTAIQLTERFIARKLRVADMEAYHEVSTTSGQADLPVRTLGVRNIEVKDGTRKLTGVSRNTLDGIKSVSGVPRWYCLQGRLILFYPTPVDATTIAIRTYQDPTPFSIDADTHDILTSYPDLYLYGSAMHMEAHLKDDARVPTWRALFLDGIKEANQADLKLMSVARTQMRPSARTDLNYKRG